MRKNKYNIILFFLFSVAPFLNAQNVGIRTDLLYLASTTPNLGIDVRLSNHHTLSFLGGYNPFRFSTVTAGGLEVNRKLSHWSFIPEYKYWFCRAYERWFVCAYALYCAYNVEGIRPLTAANARHKGNMGGAGIGIGYQWGIARNWGLEAEIGAGYLYLDYNKYDSGACGEFRGHMRKHTFGPQRACVSFIYYIH